MIFFGHVDSQGWSIGDFRTQGFLAKGHKTWKVWKTDPWRMQASGDGTEDPKCWMRRSSLLVCLLVFLAYSDLYRQDTGAQNSPKSVRWGQIQCPSRRSDWCAPAARIGFWKQWLSKLGGGIAWYYQHQHIQWEAVRSMLHDIFVTSWCMNLIEIVWPTKLFMAAILSNFPKHSRRVDVMTLKITDRSDRSGDRDAMRCAFGCAMRTIQACTNALSELLAAGTADGCLQDWLRALGRSWQYNMRAVHRFTQYSNV